MQDSGSNLAHDGPEPAGPRRSAQVLPFRPRDRSTERPNPGPHGLAHEPNDAESALLDDLAQYEQDQEDEDVNHPRRMLMNVIAVAVVMILIGVGVWLADTIAQMERDQDCVLQGRQNCAPIEVPVQAER